MTVYSSTLGAFVEQLHRAATEDLPEYADRHISIVQSSALHEPRVLLIATHGERHGSAGWPGGLLELLGGRFEPTINDGIRSIRAQMNLL